MNRADVSWQVILIAAGVLFAVLAVLLMIFLRGKLFSGADLIKNLFRGGF